MTKLCICGHLKSRHTGVFSQYRYCRLLDCGCGDYQEAAQADKKSEAAKGGRDKAISEKNSLSSVSPPRKSLYCPWRKGDCIGNMD